jgi:hypothetical protein
MNPQLNPQLNPQMNPQLNPQMNPQIIQKKIIESFNPTLYGISVPAWMALTQEEKQKIFQKHISIMQAQMYMIQNNSIQDERIKRIDEMDKQNELRQQASAASQQAYLMQQQMQNNLFKGNFNSR